MSDLTEREVTMYPMRICFTQEQIDQITQTRHLCEMTFEEFVQACVDKCLEDKSMTKKLEE